MALNLEGERLDAKHAPKRLPIPTTPRHLSFLSSRWPRSVTLSHHYLFLPLLPNRSLISACLSLILIFLVVCAIVILSCYIIHFVSLDSYYPSYSIPIIVHVL